MHFFKRITFIILLSCIAVYADDDNIRNIEVTGKSEIKLDAQNAIVYINAKTVNREMQKSHEELRGVIISLDKKLNKIGLKDKNIIKSVVLQGPENVWERNTRVLKGYYSICNIELRVDNIEKLNDIYKELSNYQEIKINWTEYKRNDEFDVKLKEYEKALVEAKRKAEVMSKSLGSNIGKVINIQEISEGYRFNTMENMVRGNADEKIDFGSVTISVAVKVKFELK